MAFVNIGTGATGTGTTATLIAPASIADNNILTAVLFTQFTGRTITPPGGWSAVANATFNKTFINRDQNAYQISTFTKVAASESGNYAFGVSVSSGWLGFITQHSGRNTSAPVTAAAKTDANGIAGTSQTYNLTGVTAAASDDLIWFGSGNAGAGTAVFTPPGGFTTQSANSLSAGGAGIYLSTQDAVSAGATGTLTGTESGQSCDICGIVVALAAGTAAVINQGSVPAQGPGVGPKGLLQFRAFPYSKDIVAQAQQQQTVATFGYTSKPGPGVGPFSNLQFSSFPYSNFVAPPVQINPVVGSWARITPPGPGVGPMRRLQFQSPRLSQVTDVGSGSISGVIFGGTFDVLTPMPGLMI